MYLRRGFQKRVDLFLGLEQQLHKLRPLPNVRNFRVQLRDDRFRKKLEQRVSDELDLEDLNSGCSTAVEHTPRDREAMGLNPSGC